MVNDLISKNKQLYYNDKIANAENNSKDLFKISKELLYKNNKNILPSSSSGKELANQFGQYFSNKITSIRTDLDNILENTDEEKHPTTTAKLEIN